MEEEKAIEEMNPLLRVFIKMFDIDNVVLEYKSLGKIVKVKKK